MGKNNDGKLTFEIISWPRSVLMAMAIVWIVFFHASIPAPDNMFLRAMWYFFFDFGGGIGVNIFFILSGFGLMYSNFKRCVYSSFSNLWHYLLKRFIKLIPIYTIVFIIYYFLFHFNDGESFIDFLSKYTIVELFINGFREYWFVHAILMMYLLFPLIAYLFDKYNIWIVFSGLLILSIGIDFTIYYLNVSLYSNIEIFLTRIPCFIIGNLLGILSIRKYKYDIKLFIIFLLIFLISIIGFFVLNHYNIGGMRAIRYIYIVMATSFICVLSYLLSSIHEKLRILKWLGTITYEIYLLHILIFLILRRFTSLGNVWLILLITLVSSIVLAAVISFATNTINKKIKDKNKQLAAS